MPDPAFPSKPNPKQTAFNCSCGCLLLLASAVSLGFVLALLAKYVVKLIS